MLDIIYENLNSAIRILAISTLVFHIVFTITKKDNVKIKITKVRIVFALILCILSSITIIPTVMLGKSIVNALIICFFCAILFIFSLKLKQLQDKNEKER